MNTSSASSDNGSTMAAQLRGLATRGQTAWRGLAARERVMVLVAAVFVAGWALWQFTISPPLRTLARAPDQIARLDIQLQRMQQMAAEAATLKGRPTPSVEEATRALQAATQQRFGEQGRVALTGDRATVTLQSVPSDALWSWMTEVRSAARVRPVDIQLVRRGDASYDGTVVMTLPPPR